MELVEAHGEGRKGAGAGRVDDAVGATEVEAIGDAAGNDVAEQAGEGSLLPGYVAVRDAIADRERFVLGDAAVAQGFEPDGALQAGAEMHDELGRSSGTQDAADSAAVEMLEGALHRVLEHLLRHDEGQQLDGVGGLHELGRGAEVQAVEGHLAEEAAALAVCLIRSRGVRVVVVLDEPVRRRHVFRDRRQVLGLIHVWRLQRGPLPHPLALFGSALPLRPTAAGGTGMPPGVRRLRNFLTDGRG